MPCGRSWMYARLDNVGFLSTEFINGVHEFVDFAFSQHAFVSRNRIKCPCVKCDNRLLQTRNDVMFHLHSKGFTGDYTVWVAHGEDDDDDVVSESNRVDDVAAEPSNSANLVDNPYRRMVIDSCYLEFDSAGGGTSFSEELPNGSAAKFFGLLKDADEPLYSSCNKHTKLSAVAQFLNVKSEFNLSASCYDRIMTIVKDLLPTDEKLPANFYKAKQMVTTLGLSYVKIHACPNNCMLYYSKTESMTECVVCGHPRYKPRTQSRDRSKKNNVPYKVLRYLPLIPRLQRLYMSTKTAEHMTWHAHNRSSDGVVRSPVDSEAWQHFNNTHSSFAYECRNVRLGLCTDGFSPFGPSAKPYSCWPVILCVYNLPPWMCMKQSYLLLNMVIPGPKSPVKNIDEGVETFDAFKKQNFQLRAALMWTISDFPAYAMLSGWSTHGRLACPYCMERNNLKARMDLKALCKRPELELVEHNGKVFMPKASFTLTKEQINDVCRWVKQLKFPDGYVSNIARKVQDDDNKFYGMKSHDCHVFMQRLLPIAFRDLLSTPIWEAITELSHFFRDICSTDLRVEDMEELETNIVVTLCKLEKIFPPGFFDSMEHLPVHLAYEAKVGGPVQFRWMYPFERCMHHFQKKATNRSSVEASICESYIVEEISTFCSLYFDSNITTRLNRVPRNDDGGEVDSIGRLSIFSHPGRAFGPSRFCRYLTDDEYKAAELYVLLNCEEIEPYIEKFESEKRSETPNISDGELEKLRVTTFPAWFKTFNNADQVDEQIENMAAGPSRYARFYNGYFVNGFKFHTHEYGKNRQTMNYGVCVKGSCYNDNDCDFYGVLVDIIELEYIGTGNKAQQVCYTSYPSKKRDRRDWWAVCKVKTRSRFSIPLNEEDNQSERVDGFYQEEEFTPFAVSADLGLDDPGILVSDFGLEEVDLILESEQTKDASDDEEEEEQEEEEPYLFEESDESEEDDIIVDGLEFDYFASDDNADESEDIDMDKGVNGKIAKKGGTMYIRRNNISRYLKSSKNSFPATDLSPALTNSVSPTPSLPPVMAPTHPPSLTNPSPPILHSVAETSPTSSPANGESSNMPNIADHLPTSQNGHQEMEDEDHEMENEDHEMQNEDHEMEMDDEDESETNIGPTSNIRGQNRGFTTPSNPADRKAIEIYKNRTFSTMMNKARIWAMKKAKTTNIAETKECFPEFVGAEIWTWLIDNVWTTNAWLKKSQAGSKNRLTLKDGSISKHTSGSIPMLLHGRRLEKDEKRYVSEAEVFDKTHKRANGEFVDNKSKKASDKYADEMIKKYGSEDAAKNHEFDPEVWSKVVGGVGHGYLYGFGRGDPRLILGTSHDSSMTEPCNEESSQSAHIGTQAELEEIVKQVLDGVLPQCLQDALRNLGFQLPNPPISGSTPRDDGVYNDEGRGNGDGLEGHHDA
ncbi:Transposon, En/Spm-like protein [Corchorus capsularis]|uniref:Transposon, En/Spm-like protein n=1 Tax=Corchorus capsularis TaxID=210143 RepID=A0A1R3GI53_COCAP|nr:Transposon, En/Spm-like protein [Corchorus capsularis]